jgi:hypothetical protein
MTETRGERRAETAKQNDDSDIIESADEEGVATRGQQGRAGGNLQRDVATQSEEERVRDAEANEGVTKEDDIAHGQRREVRRPATHVVTERD